MVQKICLIKMYLVTINKVLRQFGSRYYLHTIIVSTCLYIQLQWQFLYEFTVSMCIRDNENTSYQIAKGFLPIILYSWTLKMVVHILRKFGFFIWIVCEPSIKCICTKYYRNWPECAYFNLAISDIWWWQSWTYFWSGILDNHPWCQWHPTKVWSQFL